MLAVYQYYVRLLWWVETLPTSWLDSYEGGISLQWMYAKVGNPFYSVRFSLIFLAAASPTTAAISSSEACLMRLTLLNVLSRAVFLFSPIPLMLSKADATWLLLRLSRWKVMAKRCTSFCIFSNRWNKGVLCFTPMVSGGNRIAIPRCGACGLWPVRLWGYPNGVRLLSLLSLLPFAPFHRR